MTSGRKDRYELYQRVWGRYYLWMPVAVIACLALFMFLGAKGYSGLAVDALLLLTPVLAAACACGYVKKRRWPSLTEVTVFACAVALIVNVCPGTTKCVSMQRYILLLKNSFSNPAYLAVLLLCALAVFVFWVFSGKAKNS